MCENAGEAMQTLSLMNKITNREEYHEMLGKFTSSKWFSSIKNITSRRCKYTSTSGINGVLSFPARGRNDDNGQSVSIA